MTVEYRSLEVKIFHKERMSVDFSTRRTLEIFFKHVK